MEWEWGQLIYSPCPLFCLGRVVKEEISDDNAHLPCFNGRVVSWVRGPGTEGSIPPALPSSSEPQSVLSLPSAPA